MSILDLLMPQKCMFCGQPLSAGQSGVCAVCLNDICLLPYAQSVRKGEFFDLCTSALLYEGAVRQALHRFKFSGRQSYAAPFAKTVSYCVRTYLDASFDYVTFMPTNKKNLKKRGYNHAQLLAGGVGEELGVPVICALKKTRETKPMFGLKEGERRANILGAFELAAEPCLFKEKSVLLVDDIITTGASLSECARVLKSAGAKHVYGAAVATAPNAG